jgi:hypothetical protein
MECGPKVRTPALPVHLLILEKRVVYPPVAVEPWTGQARKMSVEVDRNSALWKELYAKNEKEGVYNAEKLADSIYRYRALSDKLTKARHRLKTCSPKKNLK